MSKALLPQSFWFRLAIPCPRIDEIPRTGQRLLDLPDSARLPQTAQLEGLSPTCEFRVGWNPGGLGVSVRSTFTVRGEQRDDGPLNSGVVILVDTRDTRNISRATRFCHRFEVRLLAGPAGSLTPRVAPRVIARAQADAPLGDPALILARVDRLKPGWRLEVFLPAGVLNGFDPETNRRLGFCILAYAPGFEMESLGAGAGFPLESNPGLWSTLELADRSTP